MLASHTRTTDDRLDSYTFTLTKAAAREKTNVGKMQQWKNMKNSAGLLCEWGAGVADRYTESRPATHEWMSERKRINVIKKQRRKCVGGAFIRCNCRDDMCKSI